MGFCSNAERVLLVNSTVAKHELMKTNFIMIALHATTTVVIMARTEY